MNEFNKKMIKLKYAYKIKIMQIKEKPIKYNSINDLQKEIENK